METSAQAANAVMAQFRRTGRVPSPRQSANGWVRLLIFGAPYKDLDGCWKAVNEHLTICRTRAQARRADIAGTPGVPA